MKRKVTLLINLSVALMIACSLTAQVKSNAGKSENDDIRNVCEKDRPGNLLVKIGQSVKSTDDYCIPSGNCNSGDGFTSFEFAEISNIESGCSPDGYGDFTSMTGSAQVGSAYTASFQSGYSNQFASMWIDYNDDEEFSEIERVITDFEIQTSNTTYSTEVTIPPFAQVGPHRLRIGACWNGASSTDPCGTFQYGEWEDYTINISGTNAQYNAVLVSIDINEVSPAGNFIPKATVGNFGLETISFPVTMTEPVTGYTSTVQVTDLEQNETIQIEFDTWNIPLGEFTIEACTELEGDEIPDNDCLSKTVSFINMNRQMVLTETATGTWCEWCPAAQNGCDDLLINWNKVAIVEHHVDDDFSNEFSSSRIQELYFIGGYPTACFDGRLANMGGGGSSTSNYLMYVPKYDSCMNITSPVIMNMEVSHEGNEYTAVITINKDGEILSENNVLHFIVTQSNIEFSWQSMTHVEHVNRLMVPDQFGTPVDFGSGSIQVVTLNFTMDPEWPLEDCEFIAAFQNMDEGQGYQSGIPGYPTKYVVYQTIKQGAIDLNVGFTASADTIMPGTTVNFANLTHGGYVNTPEIYQWYFLGATPDTSTMKDPSVVYNNPGDFDVMLIVNRGWQIDTLTIEHAIHVNTGVGILQKAVQYVSIYPNPANERLTIKAEQIIENIEIYTPYGQLVQKIETDFQSVNINVSDLVPGLYQLKIQLEKGIVTESIIIQ